MWKLYTCFLLLAASLAAQNPNTAVYPGAIPTDTDLLVATNQARTVLSNTITNVETAIAVPDASEFLAPGVFAVGVELVKYCSIVGNTFNVCAGGRGFDGTTAVLHISGSAVVGIAAAHFPNQHAAEIKAITTALGVNLSNVQVSGVPASTSFDWSQTTQTTEDDLAAATQSSITLAPCPVGVAGANANHYVFLDDADDSPADEAVIIEGGTCTSGGATGTILVTSTGARTGGDYTVSSASAGIREALLSTAGATTVVIPPGIHVIEERVTLDEDGDALIGLGSPGTTLNGGNPPVNDTFGNEVELNWAGASGGVMLELLPPTDGRLHGIRIENIGLEGNASAARGIWTKACTGCYFRNLTLTDLNASTGDAGFFILSGDGAGTGKSFRNNKLDFINIRMTTASTGAGMRFERGTNVTSDINTNTFEDINIAYFGEAGIYANAADGNVFRRVGASGGTGPGWLTPATAIFCGQQIFLGMAFDYQNDCNVANTPDIFLGWDGDGAVSTLISVSNQAKVVVYHEDQILTFVGSTKEDGIFITPELCVNCSDPATALDVDGTATLRPAAAVSTIQTDSTNSRFDFITDRGVTTQIAFRFADAANNPSLDILDDGDAQLTGDLAVDGASNPTDVSLAASIGINPGTQVQASLPANGLVFCTDCNTNATCTGGGGGAWAQCRSSVCDCRLGGGGAGGGIDCSAPVELTVAAGAITIPNQACFTVDTQADASTDDLDLINCTAGDRFILTPENTTRTVVVKDDDASLDLQADFSLNYIHDLFSGYCITTNVVIEEDRSNAGT